MAAAAKRARLVLAVFCLLGFAINTSTFSALGVVLPAMVAEQHWSWKAAGLGFTLMGAATGLSSFLPVILIRRLGLGATIAAGAALLALGLLCFANTHAVWLYFAGAMLIGMGFQLTSLIPATFVLAAIFERPGRALGTYFTFVSLGSACGPLIAIGFLNAFDDQWRSFWLAQTGLTLVIGVGSAVLLGRLAGPAPTPAPSASLGPAVARAQHRQAVIAAVRTPQFLILFAAYFIHLVVGVAVSGLSVAHLVERGAARETAAAMLSLESLAQAAGRAFGAGLGDRVKPRHVLIFALLSLVVGSAALGVASGYVTMVIYAIGVGLGFGLTPYAITMLLPAYFGRERYLELFSLVCLSGGVAAGAAAFTGAVRDRTGEFGSTFQLFAALSAGVLIAVLFMRPPREPVLPDPASR